MTLVAPSRRLSTASPAPNVLILADALSPESRAPRALTEIGGKPVLWHAMMHFSHFGMKRFAISLNAEAAPVAKAINQPRYGSPDWRVQLLKTTDEVSRGERLRLLREHAGKSSFLMTTGEGVSDIDLDDLLAFHRGHGCMATVVAVRPQARFGRLDLDEGRVREFAEKPQYDQGWTVGPYYVLEPSIFDRLDLETDWLTVLANLAAEGQLMAYQHDSFWQGVETLKDRQELNALWETGSPPWKTWA